MGPCLKIILLISHTGHGVLTSALVGYPYGVNFLIMNLVQNYYADFQLIQFSRKILFLLDNFLLSASIIFLLVFNWHDIPFSIRLIVKGEIFAFRASSALLIMSSSLNFFTKFFPILFSELRQHFFCASKYIDKIKGYKYSLS